VPVLICEMDGSMLPVVETAEPMGGEGAEGSEKDPPSELEGSPSVPGARARFRDSPLWCHLGSVEEAGDRLAVCALEEGAGRQTKIHGVGDGAVWI
jgi:hypothetical protein